MIVPRSTTPDDDLPEEVIPEGLPVFGTLGTDARADGDSSEELVDGEEPTPSADGAGLTDGARSIHGTGSADGAGSAGGSDATSEVGAADESPSADDVPTSVPGDAPAGDPTSDGPAAGSAAGAPAAPSAKPSSSAAMTAEELRQRSKRLFASLSARSRGEGWETPEGELAKYRSRWRSGMRRILQRVIFRGVVNSQLTTSAVVPRRVRSVRGPFVLVSNHTSHIDAPMLMQGMPWAQARFLSTGVAYDYFFTKWHRRLFVRLLFNAFPIDRGGSRKHAGFSRRLLRAGVPILVFPEGTRQKDGKMSEFKPGAAALAIGVGVPVIPAAIVGAHEAMPKGRSWPKKGRPPVAVVFGEPMVNLEDETAVDYIARIRARVKELYDGHHDEVLGIAPRDEEENA